MTDRNYNDPAYKKFRQDVLLRDKRKCQWPKCGSRKRLRVHHIRTWSEHPALRFVVSNGITLCKEHHDNIWGQEETHERLFFIIIQQKKTNDKRPRQPKKAGRTKQSDPKPPSPKTKSRKRKKASFARRYAIAKRKIKNKRAR